MAQAGWPRFMLRLPPDLKRWVDAEAERNGASINSEIIRSVRERMDRAISGKPEDFSGNQESECATNEKGDEASGLGNQLRRPDLNTDGGRQ